MPFIEPGDMITAEPLPGWKGRFVHSETMTFSHYDIAADAVPLHEHHHPEEEVWTVIEGELVVTIGGVQRTLGPGGVAVVPSDTPHSARALTATRAIVADHPRRQHLPGVHHDDVGPGATMAANTGPTPTSGPATPGR